MLYVQSRPQGRDDAKDTLSVHSYRGALKAKKRYRDKGQKELQGQGAIKEL